MEAGKFLFTAAGFLFTAAVGVVVAEPTDTWMVGALTFAGSVTLGAAISEVVIHSAHKRKEHDGQD